MLNRRNAIAFVFVTLIFGTTLVCAQNRFSDIEDDVNKMLLKKDLRQAIKEAETAPANDLESLLRRLTLYRRAANSEKIALTVRQIIERPDFKKNYYQSRGFLEAALRSENFQDVPTLQLYLQKVEFNENIYARYVKLCSQNKTACDVEGFDRWLGEKDAEAEKSSKQYFSDNYGWANRRIGWRKQFGLDYAELTNKIVEAVRRDPADLEAALRYAAFFRDSTDLHWLAENFSSQFAYGFYELGDRIGHLPDYSLATDAAEAQAVRRIAVRLLLKSLEMPFNEKDVLLIYSYKLRFVSVQPKIGNYEKQMRFWTKQSLAENYKNLGEPQSAQPIVEELTKLDKSDILSDNPTYLAGAVQAASGARAVESEILRQQAARQDSYDYWQERIAYYYGRNEPELMFSSYMQAFAAVPIDLAKEDSDGTRIFYVRRFADFVRSNFGQNASKTISEDWSTEDKRRYQRWKDAETFLRNEFEKTKPDIKYSYELAQIITANEFADLADEILAKSPEIITSAASRGLLNSSDRLLRTFLKSENIPAGRTSKERGHFSKRFRQKKPRNICQNSYRCLKNTLRQASNSLKPTSRRKAMMTLILAACLKNTPKVCFAFISWQITARRRKNLWSAVIIISITALRH
jgi:hypothetical protein